MENNRDTKCADIPDVDQNNLYCSGANWKCVIKAAAFSIMVL